MNFNKCRREKFTVENILDSRNWYQTYQICSINFSKNVWFNLINSNVKHYSTLTVKNLFNWIKLSCWNFCINFLCLEPWIFCRNFNLQVCCPLKILYLSHVLSKMHCLDLFPYYVHLESQVSLLFKFESLFGSKYPVYNYF